jgi:hypothetical protein
MGQNRLVYVSGRAVPIDNDEGSVRHQSTRLGVRPAAPYGGNSVAYVSKPTTHCEIHFLVRGILTNTLNNKVIYLFRLESGVGHRFDVEFDRPPAGGDLPAWTRLEADKCPHCPLANAPGAHCPAAADLVPVVKRFSELSSIDRIDVHVVTPEFEARKRTDTQTALSALMGLILATSTCPILGRMRPLAYTHKPFATPTERVYRIVSMHLLGCFLRGEPAGLEGLDGLFSDIDQLNHAFSDRLKRAAQRDAGINALLALQSRSTLASMSIESELENIRAWFQQTPGDGGEIAPRRINGA